MATIQRKQLDNLTDELNALSEEGQRMILNVLENAEWNTIEELREIVAEAMEQICGTITDMAASRTASFYDEARTASVGKALGAEPLSGRKPEATRGSVRAGIQSVVETGATEQFGRFLTARVDYEVKRASGECIYRNGARDPLEPRFARVPSGSETCAFCIMLASRGFVYRDAKTAGEGDHYHPNCDCRIVQGYDHIEVGTSRRMSVSTSIEGYDMDKLYDDYLESLKDGTLDYQKLRENAANSKRGKRGKHRQSGASSHVAKWSSEKFESYGDFVSFIREADSIEDLRERCEIAASEWKKTGLGDTKWNDLKRVVFAMRKEIAEIAKNLAEP
ncbi:MAG: hypothetical protein IKV48_00445 [Eggerthellaceae bacterium]|nr:hypothetical protein [Eggerthellaceae bacterium]